MRTCRPSGASTLNDVAFPVRRTGAQRGKFYRFVIVLREGVVFAKKQAKGN